MLMDAFSYCEGTTLVMEAIFNIKYMAKQLSRKVAYKSLSETWTARLLEEGEEGRGGDEKKVGQDSRVSLNTMKADNHKHTILTVFPFPNQCSVQTHTYYIHSVQSNYNYTVTPIFQPTFSQNHYYLAACTAIDKSPPGQVTAWLKYHFYHGVDHFTIYLNDRVDFWEHYLRNYTRSGLVNLVEYTYERHKAFFEQASILVTCNRRYRFASSLVMYSDVDEYMLTRNTDWRLVDVVKMYDRLFPTVDTFRIYNTFHACRNYSYSYWGRTQNLLEICPRRWEGIVREERWKQIVRPCQVPYVQVHHVSYADSLFINPKKDLVMLHFKMGCNRGPFEAYQLHSQVLEGVLNPF